MYIQAPVWSEYKCNTDAVHMLEDLDTTAENGCLGHGGAEIWNFQKKILFLKYCYFLQVCLGVFISHCLPLKNQTISTAFYYITACVTKIRMALIYWIEPAVPVFKILQQAIKSGLLTYMFKLEVPSKYFHQERNHCWMELFFFFFQIFCVKITKTTSLNPLLTILFLYVLRGIYEVPLLLLFSQL